MILSFHSPGNAPALQVYGLSEVGQHVLRAKCEPEWLWLFELVLSGVLPQLLSGYNVLLSVKPPGQGPR